MKPVLYVRSLRFGKVLWLAAFFASAPCFVSLDAQWNNAQAAPIATDSRIKTFVYNANEVFSVTTHYGYQSNVEFGTNEIIDTVSVGDRVGWQIVPAGRRLFIRAMEENAHTNMTVVTNQRAYQFDLRSSSANAVFGSEELTYVVRFFYPDEAGSMPQPPLAAYTPPPIQPVAIPPAPIAAEPLPVASRSLPSTAPIASSAIPVPAPRPATPKSANNYRYTYSGSPGIAPLKIYDDGRTTYLKLPKGNTPQISVLTANGQSMNVPVRRTADGLMAIDIVAPRLSLRQGAQEVIVYNEMAG